uniref:Uncharacterized protein n=1 Tax=Octopus bimaculoides TaxID=37653 RepID=A0A0L8GI87_OCTBM
MCRLRPCMSDFVVYSCDFLACAFFSLSVFHLWIEITLIMRMLCFQRFVDSFIQLFSAFAIAINVFVASAVTRSLLVAVAPLVVVIG